MPVDINAEIHQEDLVEEEEVGELANSLENVGIEENLLNLQIGPVQIIVIFRLILISQQ